MAQSIFQTHNGRSPVAQDFIWMGEYTNGTHLSEFNLDNGDENSFYDLERDRLVRFGLIGQGTKMFSESDGVFNIRGISVELGYRVDGKLIKLTGYAGKYTDIITYKDAESLFVQGGGVTKPQITQYTFGYKAEIEVDGIKFYLKPLVKVPANAPVHLNTWLVADQDLDGELVIFRNGKEVRTIKAPMKKHVGGELNWIVE